MNLYYKLIIIILGIAYLISPADIIPEIFIPYIGWIDDTVVIGTLLYLIRYGKLPNFSFNKKGFKKSPDFKENFTKKKTQDDSSTSFENKNSKQKTSTEKRNKSPHEILGVKLTATKEEIQQAYKDKIKKYHPDKLSHLGEEFADLANEKFLEISKAYDELRGNK